MQASLKTCFLLAAMALSGCSHTLEPKIVEQPIKDYDLVDLTRVDRTKYDEDFAQCARLANQDVMDITRTAAGALNTAADRASLGILGNRQSKDADRRTVLKRCLQGRGYNLIR